MGSSPCIPLLSNCEDERGLPVAKRKGNSGNENAGTTQLPEDVITHILVRLPVKSLGQYKCVCKVWYDLIVSPYFTAVYQTNSKLQKATLFCSSHDGGGGGGNNITRTGTTNNIIKFRVLDDSVPKELTIPASVLSLEIVGCSHGVVCLSLSMSMSRSHEEHFALWNPTTRQFRQIYPLDHGYDSPCFGAGFCFDHTTNTFKVTRLSKLDDSKGCITARLDVFIANSNSWTEKKLLLNPMIKLTNDYLHEATCVKKYLFWTLKHNCEHWFLIGMPEAKKYIVCYDMVDEVFTQIQFPHLDGYRRVCPCVETRLLAYRETIAICVLKEYGTSFDLWVLNDYGSLSQSWSMQLTLRSSLQRIVPIGVVSMDENVNFFIVDTPDGECLYNPNTETFEPRLDLNIDCGYAMYNESLVSVIS